MTVWFIHDIRATLRVQLLGLKPFKEEEKKNEYGCYTYPNNLGWYDACFRPNYVFYICYMLIN